MKVSILQKKQCSFLKCSPGSQQMTACSQEKCLSLMTLYLMIFGRQMTRKKTL